MTRQLKTMPNKQLQKQTCTIEKQEEPCHQGQNTSNMTPKQKDKRENYKKKNKVQGELNTVVHDTEFASRAKKVNKETSSAIDSWRKGN